MANDQNAPTDMKRVSSGRFREHFVKSWPLLFDATLRGVKKHEMRVADRDYRVGDALVLLEYDPDSHTYTGRRATALITYITSWDNHCALSRRGLAEGYCILSIELVEGPSIE